jgi:hypothetical protein
MNVIADNIETMDGKVMYFYNSSVVLNMLTVLKAFSGSEYIKPKCRPSRPYRMCVSNCT